MLQETETENVVRLLEAQHHQHCCALDYGAGKEVFDHHWKAASEILAKMSSMLFPWYDENLSKESIYKSLREKYVAAYGEQDNPETAERIKKTVEFLKGMDKSKAKPRIEPKKKRKNRSRIG